MNRDLKTANKCIELLQNEIKMQNHLILEYREALQKISKNYQEIMQSFIQTILNYQAIVKKQGEAMMKYRSALEKIADPRKRDHQEPDSYTQLGCVMHIAEEALE